MTMEAIIISWHYSIMKMRNNGKTEHVKKIKALKSQWIENNNTTATINTRRLF